VLGLAQAYPNMSQWLDSNLVQTKAAMFRVPATACGEYVDKFSGQDIYSYFKRGNQALFDAVPSSISKVAGVMGLRAPPSIPLYFYKAFGDEISPIADTDSLVAEYCKAGASIHYVKDLIGGHNSEAVTGAPDALSWLKDRLDGVPAAGGCSTQIIASRL